MEKYAVVGKRLPRLDGSAKVTGEAKFAGDISLPRMLYGKILRSPYPHAKILNIDTSKAERLPGVKAVITGRDTKEMKYSQGEGFAEDLYPLAPDRVRYIGDDVAAVAAIDEDIAEEALNLIKVEYEELPAVFDPEEAIKPGAPQLHDHAEGNICWKTLLKHGNIEKGFRESDYIREDRYKTVTVHHCQMEPHAVLASIDTSGKLTVWPTCMAVHARRSLLSKILKIPESGIRVINPYVGGAFGGKAGLLSLDICAAIFSKKTGRPVRIAYTREEQFTSTQTDYSIIIELKSGVKKDGTLIAQEFKAYSNKGAYTGYGPLSTYLLAAYTLGTYKVPNIEGEACSVYTNTPTSAPKRSHQNPQLRFALETHLDMIAEELAIDPVELRLKNAVQTGDTLPTTSNIISCGLSRCIQRSAESMGWKEKRGKLPRGKGIGMGCTYFFGGGAKLPPPHSPSSAAFVKCNPDGTVNLLSGYVDTGTGAGSMYAQIAAEELGIAADDIKVTLADTEVTPTDLSSHLSSACYITGNAVKAAAADAKRQIFEVVAEKLEANIEDLEAKDRQIYVKGSPERKLSFFDAVKASMYEKDANPILGRGYYTPGVPFGNFKTGEGGWSPTYVFANAVAEVEVDEDTGEVKIHRLAVAHDCGFAINPMEVEGQIDGSASMAQGQALFEELCFEKGQILNPSFLDYKLPLSLNTPKRISIAVESIDPKGPFGGKEAGEGSTATTVPAIANAIYDAIGVRIKDLPITPEKILKALEEKKGVKP